MESAFPANVDDELYQIAQYHLAWRNENLVREDGDGGKMIRPRLAIMGCQAVHGYAASAYPLAAAVQLFHDFTLVHDDIQDHSDLRRGRKTVWNLWGIAKAINVGDVLHMLSHRAMGQFIENGVPAERVVRVMRDFEDAAMQVAEGQHLDMSYEDRVDLSEPDYLRMIGGKTAALLAASVSLGAVVGGGDDDSVRALHDYGIALGLAFQIQDDIIGIWGKPEVTGKPFAIDIYGRKKSLPITLLLNRARDEDARQLRQIYQQPTLTDADVNVVLNKLDDIGAREYTEAQAARYYDDALSALDRVRNGDATTLDELRALLANLIKREK